MLHESRLGLTDVPNEILQMIISSASIESMLNIVNVSHRLRANVNKIMPKFHIIITTVNERLVGSIELKSKYYPRNIEHHDEESLKRILEKIPRRYMEKITVVSTDIKCLLRLFDIAQERERVKLELRNTSDRWFNFYTLLKAQPTNNLIMRGLTQQTFDQFQRTFELSNVRKLRMISMEGVAPRSVIYFIQIAQVKLIRITSNALYQYMKQNTIWPFSNTVLIYHNRKIEIRRKNDDGATVCSAIVMTPANNQ